MGGGRAGLADPSSVLEFPVGHFFINRPAVGDLDGDGTPEVVATANGAGRSGLEVAMTGIVTVIGVDRAISGHWPVVTESQVGPLPPTAPAVADLDGDARAEVIFGHGSILYVFHGDGRLWWQQRADGVFQTKPSACDLDGDGRLEVIAPADEFLGRAKIYLWRWDGTPYPGSPIELEEFFASSPTMYQHGHRTLLAIGAGDGFTRPEGSLYVFAVERGGWHLQWRRAVGAHPIARPAFVDVNHDGAMDIIGGTYTPSVYIVSAQDGAPLPGWPQSVGGPVFTSPLVVSQGKHTLVVALALDGVLSAWDQRGLLRWTVAVEPNAIDRLTLMDLDEDDRPEIVFGTRGGVTAVTLDGSIVKRWELGDYWMTGTLPVRLTERAPVSLIFGGVNNITEEAKLFVLNP
ncbi:MAG: hypothetical protein D6723_02955 [Acidobacteria bacterium]|nr:MAG: hypothetical protein D6723_02955 [Acidobacteriota bacterium]